MLGSLGTGQDISRDDRRQKQCIRGDEIHRANCGPLTIGILTPNFSRAGIETRGLFRTERKVR